MAGGPDSLERSDCRRITPRAPRESRVIGAVDGCPPGWGGRAGPGRARPGRGCGRAPTSGRRCGWAPQSRRAVLRTQVSHQGRSRQRLDHCPDCRSGRCRAARCSDRSGSGRCCSGFGLTGPVGDGPAAVGTAAVGGAGGGRPPPPPLPADPPRALCGARVGATAAAGCRAGTGSVVVVGAGATTAAGGAAGAAAVAFETCRYTKVPPPASSVRRAIAAPIIARRRRWLVASLASPSAPVAFPFRCEPAPAGPDRASRRPARPAIGRPMGRTAAVWPVERGPVGGRTGRAARWGTRRCAAASGSRRCGGRHGPWRS